MWEEFGLSECERLVAEQLVLAKTDRAIAAALFLSLRTVSTHMSAILRKIRARNRLEAIQRFDPGSQFGKNWPTFALSTAEYRVASLVAQGKSNSQIAGELDVSVRTVEAQAASAMRKAGADNRVQLALVAHRARAGKIIRTPLFVRETIPFLTARHVSP